MTTIITESTNPETNFPCHICGTFYKTAGELMNHWFEFGDFGGTGLREIFEMFVKYIFVSKKLGYYDDISLGTNMIRYDAIADMEKAKEFPYLLVNRDNLKKKIKAIRKEEKERKRKC